MYCFNFGDIQVLHNIHHVASNYYQIQLICNVLTYTVCGLLLIPSLYVFFRMFRTKQYNLFLISQTSILIIGELAGIATAYLV